ncbi:hypothetical protein [Streptomyces sp. NBC_00105]|uniref:hypothetical protein n=1 Tax=Streptomyces sp. NBC_00105 TaxID=2903622 RepID=UPI00324BFF51
MRFVADSADERGQEGRGDFHLGLGYVGVQVALRIYAATADEVSEREVSRWRDGAGEPTKAQAALLHKTFGAPPEPPKESTPPPLWTPEELRESMEQEKRSPSRSACGSTRRPGSRCPNAR